MGEAALPRFRGGGESIAINAMLALRCLPFFRSVKSGPMQPPLVPLARCNIKIPDFLLVADDGNIDLSRDSNREVLPRGEGVKDVASRADAGITVNSTRGIPCPQPTAGQPATMAPGRKLLSTTLTMNG